MPTVHVNKITFQAALLQWFEHSRRAFPWRVVHDPYAIVVAEKLLQQTAAGDVVAQIYQQFLERYPTPHHLAAADLDQLEQLLRPLGFRYRARELRTLATALIERHDGQVPRDLDGLLALPGVGDYIARAVLSFAFIDDVPIVDTNVARWLYRLIGLAGPLPSNPARSKGLQAIAEKLLPPGRAKEFNLAILDLCALICRPRVPHCEQCPVRPYCATGSRRPRHLGVRTDLRRN